MARDFWRQVPTGERVASDRRVRRSPRESPTIAPGCGDIVETTVRDASPAHGGRFTIDASCVRLAALDDFRDLISPGLAARESS